MAVLKINKVKCTKELNKVSWSGYAYVEESGLWVFRMAPEDEWITIPRDVFDSKGTDVIQNIGELVGRLYISDYRVEAEMLLKQIERSMTQMMRGQAQARKEKGK